MSRRRLPAAPAARCWAVSLTPPRRTGPSLTPHPNTISPNTSDRPPLPYKPHRCLTRPQPRVTPAARCWAASLTPPRRRWGRCWVPWSGRAHLTRAPRCFQVCWQHRLCAHCVFGVYLECWGGEGSAAWAPGAGGRTTRVVRGVLLSSRAHLTRAPPYFSCSFVTWRFITDWLWQKLCCAHRQSVIYHQALCVRACWLVQSADCCQGGRTQKHNVTHITHYNRSL